MTILIDDSSLRYGPSANLEVHPTAQQLGGHGSPRFGVGWARTTVRTITASRARSSWPWCARRRRLGSREPPRRGAWTDGKPFSSPSAFAWLSVFCFWASASFHPAKCSLGARTSGRIIISGHWEKVATSSTHLAKHPSYNNTGPAMRIIRYLGFLVLMRPIRSKRTAY